MTPTKGAGIAPVTQETAVDLNNMTMQSIGPVAMLLLLVFGVIMAVAMLLEEANKGRKQKQREKEWNDLNKP